MNKKAFLSLLLVFAMLMTMITGCSKETTSTGGEDTKPTQAADNEETAAEEPTVAATEKSDVKITMLNSKGEIQEALETIAAQYEELTGVSIDVQSCSTGQSPFEKISSMYNSGNPPTIAILDPTDVVQLAEEKAVDLSNETWVSDGGSMSLSVNGKVYGFPLCVEGRGIIYNKTAIESTLGTTFDPAAITCLDDFKQLCQQLRDAGMENPMVLSKEDWSLGNHQLMTVYEAQDGTDAGTAKFLEDLKAGSVSLLDNERFNQFIDTFNVFVEYNINKADPLGAVYDEDPIYLADGDAAFWYNGNWAWPNIKEAGGEGNEYGILPFFFGNDASDFANSSIGASATKQIMIDAAVATAEEQQAAKDFLNWLVYDEAGQNAMINTLNIVPAFKNITLQPTDPLGAAVKSYVDAGKTLAPSILPSDHWSVLGASMQKYLAGELTKEELAGEVESYWKK